ncbi:MAG: glycosyltransferase [Moraxella sp.]|nr:glycosyltransferase [Moraxella sp.]
MQLLSSLKHEESERGIYHISHAIIKAGHESIIVSSADNDDELAIRLMRDGNTYHQLNIPKKSWWALKQVLPLRHLIKVHKPDIIHVHSRTPAWVLYWALRPLKANERPKIVSTVYGFFNLNNYSKALFTADVIITASKSIDKHLKEKLAIKKEEYNIKDFGFDIVCVRRGVDVRNYPYRHHASVHWLRQTFAQYPELEHKKWLLFPTPIGAEYGQEWLVDILGNLQDKFPNIHAIIMDNDDTSYTDQDVSHEEFVQRVHALGLDDKITFVGKRPPDRKEWLSSANLVLALAHEPESIGMTALQAIHLGTPVIGWAKGAYADILTALFPQGLIKEQTAITLCKAVKYQLQNRIRPAMTHEYVIEQMVAETLAVYQQLNPVCKLVTKDRRAHLVCVKA